MSRKNSLNGPDLQHRKQPIHFYATSRGSLEDVRNGYCPIDFMTSPLSYKSSPSKYDIKKISPQRSSKPISLYRSPQAQINVDRVMNSSTSSKYTKLSSKIDLLEKNLNRLNGQHQSLKDMFSKSQQLSKCLQVYVSVDKLKQKLQQSKTNKYIQQKRYEARFQIIYEDYLKKFTQVKKQLLTPQCQQLKCLSQQIMEGKQHKNVINLYNDSFQTAKENIMSIDQNAKRFLNQIYENLKKESIELMNKKEVKNMIKNEKQRLNKKIQLIKVKLAQLKCITQYEMHLQKQNFMNKNHPQLNPSNKSMKKSQQIFNELQLKYMKEQTNFVGMESLDRLTYQLSTIDSNLVKILQKYETQNSNKKKTPRKSKDSQKQLLSQNKKDYKHKYQSQVLSLENQISQFNYELKGLKTFMKKSQDKISRLKINQQKFKQSQKEHQKDFYNNKNFQNSQSNEYVSQNEDIMQSIIDLEEKIKLLQENLSFFKINCT